MKLFLSHEVNTFVRWEKTKWRKLEGTLLKLGASLKMWQFPWWRTYNNYVKRCNHFGFEIACHSLLLWLISKTLILLLLLMFQDIIVLLYNILKPQIKKEIHWQFFGKNIFSSFSFKTMLVLRWFRNISVALVPQAHPLFLKFLRSRDPRQPT